MISLVMPTYRHGGIDILSRSFAHNDSSDDYELVIVDDYPGRVERGTVPAYLREKNVKLGWYGKSKPKTYPETKGGLCNAWNTALMHCRGDYVLSFSDYCWLAPNWYWQWQWIIQNFPYHLVSGGAIVYTADKPKIKDDIVTWGDASARVIPSYPWVPTEWESFYCFASVSFYEACNGLDERADHCHCYPVSSQLSHAKQLKCPILIQSDITCHVVNHRSWDTQEETAPPGCGGEGMWRITHIRSIENEPDWTLPSPNKFNLAEERRKHCLEVSQ